MSTPPGPKVLRGRTANFRQHYLDKPQLIIYVRHSFYIKNHQEAQLTSTHKGPVTNPENGSLTGD